MFFLLQLFSYSQKWWCSTQKFNQIWVLQAKNEKKKNIWKTSSIIFLVTYLNYVYINLAIFPSIFSGSIENLKKHMILALFTFQCTILATYICVCKNPSFYFSLYFEGSPPTGYPYGVMWWGGRSPCICTFPCSHGKIFLMRWIRKIQKNKKERMEEMKIRGFFKFFLERFPVLVCSPLVGNALMLPPSCDPPSGEPTRMGTPPTT